MIKSENPEKIEQFKELVNQFKKIKFTGGDEEWLNPYQIKDLDFEEICNKQGSIEVLNPWNLWYGNLDAEILVIGMDWGSVVELSRFGKEGDFTKLRMPTDKNLEELFCNIGIKIGEPYSKVANKKLFFTNAILGIRNATNNAGYVNLNAYNFTPRILLDLINVIKPKGIIIMGKIAYKAVCNLHNTKGNRLQSSNKNMRELVLESLPEICGSKLFIVYHPSPKNTRIENKGWQKIKEWIEKEKIQIDSPNTKHIGGNN